MSEQEQAQTEEQTGEAAENGGTTEDAPAEDAVPAADPERGPDDYQVTDLPEGATPDPLGNTVPVPSEQTEEQGDD